MAEESNTTVEYSPHVKRALSNYFEGLTEPVSLFIGMREESDYSDSARDGNNTLIIKAVEALRQNGVDAVPFFDEDAKLPNKVVVSKTGLQTPFVAPENAKDEAVNILNILEQNGINSLGFVTPNTEKQLLYPSLNNDIMDENKVIDLAKANPEPEKFQQILNEHGENFISDMLDEASNSPDLKQLNEQDALDIDNQNRMVGCKTLYKGGTQGANVFAVISPYEARNVPHASPKISIAKGYSGLGNNASSKGGATYVDKHSQRSYGFVYEIEANPDQKFYLNIGLETASNELDDANRYFETPVMPHRNKVKAMYLHIGDKSNGFLYKIPENDQRWQEFMALHEPSDNTIYGHLATRRKQQKDEAKIAGQAKTYQFSHFGELEIPDYRDLSNVDTETLLKSLARRVDISRDETGRLVVNGNISLNGLDIRELPKDFADIKINGQLDLGGNPQLKITSLEQLPETTHGISASKLNMDLGDLSHYSTEEFISKVCGTNAAQKDADGFYPDVYIQGNIGKLPSDFKDSKFTSIEFLGNYEFDTIEDIPETMGSVKNLKVKNQETNLSPHMFLKKTLGNCYMGAVEHNGVFYGGIMRGKVPDDYVPEQLNVNLDFSNTNIHTFPKRMGNITCKQLRLNKDSQFSNLDNFPTTSEGTIGLQLVGISDKESTRSFLEKVYGTQTLAVNSHTDKNDNIVIHNDLLLGRDNEISPDALPHDFNKVKIGGKFSLGNYKSEINVEESRRPSVGFLKSDKQIDLSGYKDKIYFDYGDLAKAEEVVLPQSINKVTFSHNKAPEISLDCSGVKNLEISNNSDLSATRLTMPKQADTIILNDAKLPKGNVEIKNATSLDIDKVPLEYTDLTISNISMMKLSNVTLNSNSKIDASTSTDLHLFNCDLSQAQEVKLPTESQINMSEVKLPRGDYDFSAQKRLFSLTFTEFAPDSTLKLPQVEASPDTTGLGGFDMEIPESYRFGINYAGVKFPEMEWNILDIKNNGLAPDEFAEIKEYCEEKAFTDKSVSLHDSDLSLVKGFKLPAKMSDLDIGKTIFPEGNVDLSGAKYITMGFADFSKCDEVKFPEKITELEFHANKFKSGSEIDVSGVDRIRFWVQDCSNLKSIKLPPEAEINIGRSQFPEGMDLDLSKNKSVYIFESDLSNLKSLRLPEGFDVKNNLKDCQLPPEVFIGEERYIAPKTEIKEQQLVEEKTQSIERETPSAAEKVFTVEEKVIEKTEFASQERSQAQAQEQKQEQEQVSEKLRKKNKLGQFIQKLRGIDVHAVTTNKEDKSKEIDITNQKSKEDKTADVAASTSRTAEGEKSKVSKRIKHLVNFARGIIQPKRTVASTNASQSNTHTQSQITKEIKDKLTQNTYDK